MKPFRISPAATTDLFEIWSYIAADDIVAADRMESSIAAAFQKIADRPDLGHFRRDLTDKPVRFFLVGAKYLVVYATDEEPLQIVRILHGARDVSGEIADEE